MTVVFLTGYTYRKTSFKEFHIPSAEKEITNATKTSMFCLFQCIIECEIESFQNS